jgi:hypothetical protein
MRPELQKYALLLDRYLARDVDASLVESTFLDTYKNDATAWSEEEFGILERLFWAVDALCLDPTLCDSDDLNESQFRAECALIRSALSDLDAHARKDE